MEVADAYTLISHAIDTGHAAHGYLVCGDLRGQCDALTERILRKLFPNELVKCTTIFISWQYKRITMIYFYWI